MAVLYHFANMSTTAEVELYPSSSDTSVTTIILQKSLKVLVAKNLPTSKRIRENEA